MDIKQKAPFELRQLMCHIVSLISIIGFILDASCAVSEERGYAYLCGRTYERTNTWNGCTRYATLSGTSFQVWKCPQDDCVTAVNASRYFVRYRLVKQRPVSYIKAPIPDESENPANDVKKIEIVQRNFGQFESPTQGEFGIGRGGRDVQRMEARILPFVVKNPHSKADMYCILVAFFENSDFVVATYVNLNTGKIVIDFQEISDSGWMLLAEESRYPFLLPTECAKQDEILVRYGDVKRQHSPPKKVIPVQPLPEVQVIVPDL